MGNAATAVGDNFTCFRKHENQGAVASGGSRMGVGKDLDDAVLAATNKNIEAGNGLVNIVSLTFTGENFPNLDTFTRTDGMCVLYAKNGTLWNKLGATEVIMDNLAPAWVKSFEVQYHFEKREYYKVVVYDIDDFNKLDNYAGHDKVGECEFALHEVVTARDQTLIRNLECDERQAGKSGVLKITGDEKSGKNNEEMNFELSGNFNSNDGFNFFLVHKFIGVGVYKPVYKSEIKSSINGSFAWNHISMLTSELANEDPEREIRIEFFKSQKSGKHTNLGYISCNLAQLKGEGQTDYVLNKGKNQQIKFTKCIFHKRNTFLEYVFGGCEIQLNVAIDFTLSNGNPAERDSLHYLDMQRNEYLQAIKATGDILQYYDSKKQIPVYGYGATVPPAVNRASHCFALNGDIFNPEVDGLDGIVAAYKSALKNVNLYGPTNFAPTVELVADMAEEAQVSQGNQKYFILLILTDGIINDMQKTIDQIVRGSRLPMSIVIVGVGSDDFESMDILDADDIPLYSMKYKRNMESDIVQFVPFREFKHNPAQLARETLDEIPRQLLDFMRKNNINPLPQTEAGRRAIQHKLTNQRSLGGDANAKGIDHFFHKRKEAFIEKMTGMGMDLMTVKDFLDDKCIHEENPELLLDWLDRPNYVNALKRNYQPPVNANAALAGGYGYMPNQGMQPQMQQQMQPQMQQQLIQPGGYAGGYNAGYGGASTGMPMGAQPQLIQQDSDDSKCKVCFARPINTVLVPCGHQCICDTCSKTLNKECPICRKKITQVVKTFGNQ